MKYTPLFPLALSLCVGFQTARADIADFAKQLLDLDVSLQDFGNPFNRLAATKRMTVEQQKAEPGVVLWRQTEQAKAYEAKHPDRSLTFGFIEERLVSIRLFIRPPLTAHVVARSKPPATPANAPLNRIFSEFQKLRRQFPGIADKKRVGIDQNNGELITDDGKLRLHYNGYCHPGENLFGVFFLVPSQKKD